MLTILHRINDPLSLRQVPPEYGVEVDIHAYGDGLVVHHDAFVDAVRFEDWLNDFHHALVILNVKEEGIESRVRDLMTQRGIENYFFLDMILPAFIRLYRSTGETRVAARVSKYESWESAVRMRKDFGVEWAFIDLHENVLPVTAAEYKQLRSSGLKTCLVSPELWGRGEVEQRQFYQQLDNNITFDGVLTKHKQGVSHFIHG